MHFIHSDGYTFALQTTTTEYMTEYQFVSLDKQPFPCIDITVQDNIGYLNALNYYSSCSLSAKSLEHGHGTVHMMKVALKYVLGKHPNIKYVELQDETFILMPGKPLITSRRLIQGRLGWYEEHLHAVPIGRTVLLLKFLRDQNARARFESKIPQRPLSWWTAQNTVKLCREIGCPHPILGTTWKILRHTIIGYDVNLQDSDTMMGGAPMQRIRNVLKNAAAFPYDLTLEAKYRTQLS
jgi:hypothetical protein